MVYFDNDNQLTIRETPINIRRVPLLDFLEPFSSKDEFENEWVEEIPKMAWMEGEVQSTLANLDWQLQSYVNAVANKYDD